MWFLILPEILNPALAGKLAEGFRGLGYGPAEILKDPPSPQGCSPGDAPLEGEGSRWDCRVEINGVVVLVSYMVDSGYFYGVHLTPPANFSAAAAVYEALTAAYGTCTKKFEYDTEPLADCTWKDNAARAVWSYNQFSGTSSVAIFDMTVSGQVSRVRAERAARAAGGL